MKYQLASSAPCSLRASTLRPVRSAWGMGWPNRRARCCRTEAQVTKPGWRRCCCCESALLKQRQEEGRPGWSGSGGCGGAVPKLLLLLQLLPQLLLLLLGQLLTAPGCTGLHEAWAGAAGGGRSSAHEAASCCSASRVPGAMACRARAPRTMIKQGCKGNARCECSQRKGERGGVALAGGSPTGGTATPARPSLQGSARDQCTAGHQSWGQKQPGTGTSPAAAPRSPKLIVAHRTQHKTARSTACSRIRASSSGKSRRAEDAI